MGLLPSKIGKEDLKPGDQIYTWRGYGVYSHHGIYKGNGQVIHLNRGRGGGSLSSSAVSESSDGRVGSCSIGDFLSCGELYRFEYGVNALRFLVQRPGTCTCVSSDPPEDVVERAESFLGMDHVYSLCDNNCEDFAFYCKTQLADVSISMKTGSSGQIASFVALIISILGCIIVPDGLLPPSFIGWAPMVVFLFLMFLFFSFRLHFDAGHRVSYPLQRVPVAEYGNRMPDRHPTFMPWILKVAMVLLLLLFNLENRIYQGFRSVFLRKLTSQVIDDYCEEHSFKIHVYIINSILALVICYFTPEDSVFQEAKTFYLNGFFIVHVTNPLKLRHYVEDTLWLHLCSLTGPGSIYRWFRLVRLSSYLFGLVADQGSRGLVMPLECILNCTRMLIFWYWTPQDTDLQWMRLFLLSVCLSKLVANWRNDHLPPSEYVIAVIFATMLHNWTPEMTILPWIRQLSLCGYFTLFLINPNFRLKLGKPVDVATSMFFSLLAYDCILIILWHCIPERTISSWMRLFFLLLLCFC